MMQSDFGVVFALLVAFQLKHFFGDYVLQSEWMVHGKSLPGGAFIGPLAAHAGVHGALTLAIILIIAPGLWFLALFDFAAHFFQDRLKAHPREEPSPEASTLTKSAFWSSIGFDQMVHHFTHYLLIFVLVAYGQ